MLVFFFFFFLIQPLTVEQCSFFFVPTLKKIFYTEYLTSNFVPHVHLKFDFFLLNLTVQIKHVKFSNTKK